MSAERQLDLRQAIVQQLESLQRSGVQQLHHVTSADVSETAATSVQSSTVANSPPTKVASATTASTSEIVANAPMSAKAVPLPSPSAGTVRMSNAAPIHSLPVLSLSDRKSALQSLAHDVSECTRCAELARTRTQTVFGVGNPKARLCFFGEAPGADEDRQGEPFVGRAGQLLTKIIEACSLKREDIYILNVLKCRPPGNRNPSPDEATNCRPYFERQLEIIQPEFICCLGAIAATTLLETTVSIGRLRGQFHDWRGIKVVATYHPAYLLRNPPAKKYVWEDMQMLMKAMGIKIPKAQ